MLEILEKLTILIAPILSFTAEEIWSYLPPTPNRPASVHLAHFPLVGDGVLDVPSSKPNIEAIRENPLNPRHPRSNSVDEQKWERIIEIREEVQKKVEEIRAEKIIGNSLEAKVTIKASGKNLEFLREVEAELPTLFIISEVEIIEGSNKDLEITAAKTTGHKCPRCWNYHQGDTELCPRCEAVLS